MGGGFGEGGEAQVTEKNEETFLLVHLEHAHRRDVERAGQRVTGRHGTTVAEVGVLRAESLETGGYIRYEGIRKQLS